VFSAPEGCYAPDTYTQPSGYRLVAGDQCDLSNPNSINLLGTPLLA
jgi:hypothetical protein